MSTDFFALPEDCILDIITLTSPRDACRMASVSTIFRSAAESDGVWDRFLPPDYKDIMSRSDHASFPLSFPMKKHLFLRLCDAPLLIDQGKKSFSLDKLSGKKCFMIAARELTIIWGDMPSYWNWISLPDSRFAEVAELRQVCWLEIRGKINTNMLSQNTNYGAYMVFKFTSNAHGFVQHPVEASLYIYGGVQTSVRALYLHPNGEHARHYQIVPRHIGFLGRRRSPVLNPQEAAVPIEGDGHGRYPKQRNDGWLEIELGEYFNEGGLDQELEMSLVEVKGGNWKSGLVVQGIEIRPKESK